ncbi:MAG: GGDEF domain-containing protein, partial [Caldimonas sp.]
MLSHPASLLAAAAGALFLAAAASAWICLRQRARRGASWWAAANALLGAGLVLQAAAPGDAILAPLAAVLTLQWPVLTLVGLRRFFSRGASSLPAWADGVVLAVTALAAVGTWLAPFDAVRPEQVLAAAALVASLYAAAAVVRLEDFATTSTLKTLLFALAMGAMAQAAALAFSFASPPFAATPAQAGLVASLATATVALLMTQLALAMNHERQIAHLRASQRKLRHLVDVDALTQLPNRRHFHELAERAIKAAPEAATVLVFDVDQLRRINELLGHANGDEALRQVGTALRETLRRRDVAGRLGGDEFAAVLPRTRAADADNVVTRINARLDDRQVAPRIARIALNVGITQMQAGEALPDALRRAEIALTVSRDEARQRAV